MPPPRSCASQTGLAFSLGRSLSPSPLLSGNWTITERRARMPNNRGTEGSERSVIISRAVLSASPRRALNHAIRSATRTLYMNCDASVSGLTCMPPPTQSGRLKDEAKRQCTDDDHVKIRTRPCAWHTMKEPLRTKVYYRFSVFNYIIQGAPKSKPHWHINK